MIKKVEQNGNNIVSITLDKRIDLGAGMSEQAELRVIFNSDGTLRLITNLKVEQAREVVSREFGEYQHVQCVERFGYPEN